MTTETNNEDQDKRIRGMYTEMEQLRSSIGNINRESENSRLYEEQRFREIVGEKLTKLLTDVNGFPAQTHAKIGELEKRIKFLTEKAFDQDNIIKNCNEITNKKLEEALKVKEDQIPRWFRSILYGGLLVIAPVIGGLIQVLLKIYVG